MGFRIRYEESFVVLEVPRDKKLYASVDLVEDPTADERTEKARIQAALDEKYNRPEYNCFHRETRYIDDSPRAKRLDGQVGKLSAVDENGDEVDQMENIAINPVSAEDESLAKIEYEDMCSKIRSSMKPAWAEMAIAVLLDGMKLPDYAEAEGIKYDTAKHTFARVKKKCMEIFALASLFPVPPGYTMGRHMCLPHQDREVFI